MGYKTRSQREIILRGLGLKMMAVIANVLLLCSTKSYFQVGYRTRGLLDIIISETIVGMGSRYHAAS